MEIKRAEMTMATIRLLLATVVKTFRLNLPLPIRKNRWAYVEELGKYQVSFVFCWEAPVSCGRTDVYNEFNTLPKNGWFKRDVQRFTPEVPDTVNRYDVYLSLRHNGDYTYRNLWLFVSYNDEGGVLKTDTVNCELADEFGRWSGGGWGSYYQQEVLLNDDFRFSGEKEHVFTVQQAMRDDRIRGISDVGIRIVPHEEK